MNFATGIGNDEFFVVAKCSLDTGRERKWKNIDVINLSQSRVVDRT